MKRTLSGNLITLHLIQSEKNRRHTSGFFWTRLDCFVVNYYGPASVKRLIPSITGIPTNRWLTDTLLAASDASRNRPKRSNIPPSAVYSNRTHCLSRGRVVDVPGPAVTGAVQRREEHEA